MASKVTVVSDYSGHPINNQDVVQVKMTLKVGSDAGKVYELDFKQSELDELIERLESSKTDDPEPIIPPSIPKPVTKTKKAAVEGEPRRNKYAALVQLLADTGVDREQLIKLVQEIDPEVDTSKRLKVDLVEQVVRDRGLESQAAALGYAVNG